MVTIDFTQDEDKNFTGPFDTGAPGKVGIYATYTDTERTDNNGTGVGGKGDRGGKPILSYDVSMCVLLYSAVLIISFAL